MSCDYCRKYENKSCLQYKKKPNFLGEILGKAIERELQENLKKEYESYRCPMCGDIFVTKRYE